MAGRILKPRVADDKGGQEVKRVWGDVPVSDATNDLRVLILPEDVQKATRFDPGCCVFAQACRRSLGSSKVIFLKSVAYIDLPDEDGNMHVERFIMPSGMRALLEAFDRGQDVIPKAGFVLKAPPPSNTLDSFKRRNAKHTRSRKKALIQGTLVRSFNDQEKLSVGDPITIDLTVRNGTGRVRFTRHGMSKIVRANGVAR